MKRRASTNEIWTLTLADAQIMIDALAMVADVAPDLRLSPAEQQELKSTLRSLRAFAVSDDQTIEIEISKVLRGHLGTGIEVWYESADEAAIQDLTPDQADALAGLMHATYSPHAEMGAASRRGTP